MTSILSQQKWVFKATNSNPIIYKTKIIFLIFFSKLLKSPSHFDPFGKKISLIAEVFTNL